MKSHDGSQVFAGSRQPLVRSIATFALALALACVGVGLSATVSAAAPAAPVIAGPTAVQFAYHPSGFRSSITWDSVPGAVEYRVYHAETQYYVGSVTTTNCMIYGMQGFQYHHYVVAVDSAGATSTPSNAVDILTTAVVPPTPPPGFTVIPMTGFGIQSSTAPAGDRPVKIPYNPNYVAGDPANLRLMRFDGSSWADVTTSVDTSRSFVFGEAPLTSSFAVMEPIGTVVGPVTPPPAVDPPVTPPVAQTPVDPPVTPPVAVDPPVVAPPAVDLPATPPPAVIPPAIPVLATIVPVAGAHGSIAPSTARIVTYGSDSPTFVITPDAGYHVADVKIDGISVGPVTSYSFSDVIANHLVSVRFAPTPIRLRTYTRLAGPSQARVGHRIALRGTVSAAWAPGTVTIFRSRLVAGHWKKARAVRVSVRNGSYRYAFTPTKRGKWRMVAKFSGGKIGVKTYLRSVSRVKRVTVS